MRTNSVEVTAKNSPYKSRKIIIYDSLTIENLIRAYVLTFANDKLRKNQKHIGERFAILSASLIRTALDAAIRQACGLSTDIQKTARQHYIDVAGLLGEFGFVCSAGDEIATKKDIRDYPINNLPDFVGQICNLPVRFAKSHYTRVNYLFGNPLPGFSKYRRVP